MITAPGNLHFKGRCLNKLLYILPVKTIDTKTFYEGLFGAPLKETVNNKTVKIQWKEAGTLNEQSLPLAIIKKDYPTEKIFSRIMAIIKHPILSAKMIALQEKVKTQSPTTRNQNTLRALESRTSMVKQNELAHPQPRDVYF